MGFWFGCCGYNETTTDYIIELDSTDCGQVSMVNEPLGRLLPATPRQRDLHAAIELPDFPLPQSVDGCPPDAPDEVKRQALLDMFRDFVLEMHSGMYLTHLTATREQQEIHCQILDDLGTLNLNLDNGRIIEFPLVGVTKVYRVVRKDEHWYQVVSSAPPSDHIIIVEFSRRKLVFVFKNLQASQRFLVCMELLIRRVHQKAYQHRSPTKSISVPRAARQSAENQVFDA